MSCNESPDDSYLSYEISSFTIVWAINFVDSFRAANSLPPTGPSRKVYDYFSVDGLLLGSPAGLGLGGSSEPSATASRVSASDSQAVASGSSGGGSMVVVRDIGGCVGFLTTASVSSVRGVGWSSPQANHWKLNVNVGSCSSSA